MEQSILNYYIIRKIRENVYRIFSREQVHVELFVGTKAALLFDTGFGFNDLKTVVRSVTHLPLYVVNSHGHLDHTCGNYRFEENIFIHPRDMKLCIEHNTIEMRAKSVEDAKHVIEYRTGIEHNILPEDFDKDSYIAAGYGNLLPIEEGHIFDLGGMTLKVVELPGHTQGSIGLYYKEEKLFYAGDAIGSFVWLFMPEATNLNTYINTIEKAANLEFEKLVVAHNPAILDKSVLNDYIDCAKHLDFEHGRPFESTFAEGQNVKICTRTGFSQKDIEKPGFASIVISESHL